MNIHSCSPYCLEYNCVVEQRDTLREEAVALRFEIDWLLEDVARLRKALRPLCAFGVEDHEYNDDMPEEIDDPHAAWEWRLANSSPDTCLMVEMYQRDILAARKALEQKP